MQSFDFLKDMLNLILVFGQLTQHRVLFVSHGLDLLSHRR